MTPQPTPTSTPAPVPKAAAPKSQRPDYGTARNHNLDLLRAGAVLIVIAYHLSFQWPVQRAWLNEITRFGEYGVDLFFVLSGWLIGGLFWREDKEFGNVETGRFIVRRALRTIPPYVGAFFLSYGAVIFLRPEPFDWRYLVFLQNYHFNIPYFQVSWSLCIEEHFYLAMPLFALLLTRASHCSHFLMLVLVLLPPLFRALHPWPTGETPPFGYYFTATHLRYEGLLLGVWGSFVYQRRPALWSLLQKVSLPGLAASLLAVAITDQLPARGRYIFFFSAISFFFFFLLISVVDRKPLPWANSKIIFWIASVSYSAYLTNELGIHSGVLVLKKTPFLPEAGHLAIAAVAVSVCAVLFYKVVEAPSLKIRQRWMPSRNTRASAAEKKFTSAHFQTSQNGAALENREPETNPHFL